MEVAIFSWFFFSILVGAFGSGKELGFWGAFFLSVILSPLIGLIFVLVSKNKSAVLTNQQMIKTQQLQNKAITSMINEKKKTSIADELMKLKTLLEDGILTDEEFREAKKKIIGKSALK